MKRDADWRHCMGAAILLLALGVLLYFWRGRGANRPNVPAPAGSNPIHDTPPETPQFPTPAPPPPP